MVDLAEFSTEAEYDTFERNHQTKFSMPITSRNKGSGKLRRDLPQTTSYSRPIRHPGGADDRVACFINADADRLGETIIDEAEAKRRGFISDVKLPDLT